MVGDVGPVAEACDENEVCIKHIASLSSRKSGSICPAARIRHVVLPQRDMALFCLPRSGGRSRKGDPGGANGVAGWAEFRAASARRLT